MNARIEAHLSDLPDRSPVAALEALRKESTLVQASPRRGGCGPPAGGDAGGRAMIAIPRVQAD
ncbi:hypothetical protein [Microbacterium sp. LWS13-1.2]|uniref:hypothetical protein n=1 Tax=Microbacterium sp. LWS13-1.2 TaxID=3135264 RepID=UPI0032DB8D3D